ncbi:DNA-binding FrmR family transcriptional regulator [Arcanobacterium wilhelmae]|uniref:DNA-binding FrmR family transcriptional regulator n=1 Tax=Arcanobacterium wilhelmae TaxID=1803177 RepID=A0ABT9N9S8_9ACTO|nr:metal-sensitive transcriptional regulator [Arcanobacterium wilhelmae]MDP9800468.1 DNA-binding FrmR family transcriptional regulator [Arcanobacterium wilhelmae]WFN89887.1 metal-sensitive transcriptional regulator [Arcanobacterium wilhelmae]
MKLEPESVKASITRLKRARGQLDAVIAMLESGDECEKALTQLAAVSKAVDRAGYLVISTGMKQCIASGNEVDEEKLSKLFLSLA